MTPLPPPLDIRRLKRRTRERAWKKAIELSSTMAGSITVSFSAGEVTGRYSFPTQRRSPYSTSVTWNGSVLRSRCTCSVRAGSICMHRIAVALRLKADLELQRAQVKAAAANLPSASPPSSTQPLKEPAPPTSEKPQSATPIQLQSTPTKQQSATPIQLQSTPTKQQSATPIQLQSPTPAKKKSAKLNQPIPPSPQKPLPPSPQKPGSSVNLDKMAAKLKQSPQRQPELSVVAPDVILSNLRPRGLLEVHPAEDGLRFGVKFLYDGRIPPVATLDPSLEIVHQEKDQTLRLRRDRYWETQLERSLDDLGLDRTTQGQFYLPRGQLAWFVMDVLPILRERGWTFAGAENELRLPTEILEIPIQISIKRQIDWFTFAIKVEVDHQTLTLHQILEAWRNNRGFIARANRTYGRLPILWLEKHKSTLELLESLATSRRNASVRLEPYHALYFSTLLEKDASLVEASGNALSTFREMGKLEQLKGDCHEIQPPVSLQATLRPYQLEGYRWLRILDRWNLGGILADDMGLGKTLQVLTLLLYLAEAGSRRSSLVVVPTSVLENWRDEAHRFAPTLSVYCLAGEERWKNIPTEPPHIILTTYGLLRRDLDKHQKSTYHYVIIDESQAIKNPDSETARACRALICKHRIAITGTPIENNLRELWSQFQFLMPGILGNASFFNTRYLQPIEYQFNQDRRIELRRRIEPFILRRIKEDVAPDLPPLTESVLYCELEPHQALLYRRTLDAYRSAILPEMFREGLQKTRFTILEALTKLRQICCHPEVSQLVPEGEVVGSAKLELFLETLEEILEEGHRVLVFSQFVEVLTVIRQAILQRSIRYLYLDGQTRNRQALVNQYNDSDIPVFLISLKAGGTGLNLTGADYVIHYDPWWNPAVEAQATDRAHRIGQQKPVVAYRLIARGTIEEKILELHERKKQVVEGLLSDTVGLGRLLSLDDITFLFGSGGP